MIKGYLKLYAIYSIVVLGLFGFMYVYIRPMADDTYEQKVERLIKLSKFMNSDECYKHTCTYQETMEDGSYENKDFPFSYITTQGDNYVVNSGCYPDSILYTTKNPITLTGTTAPTF